MSACPNCGANARPNDKFCNTCGSPVAPAAAAAPPAYPPPAAGPPWGAAPPAPRCQMGHEVPPGQNYCPQGHPIALEQVQFAPSQPQYGSPPGNAYPPPAGGAKYAQAGPNVAAPNYSGSSGSYGTPPAYPPAAYPGAGAPAPAAYGGAPAPAAPSYGGAPSPAPAYTPAPVAAPAAYSPPANPAAPEPEVKPPPQPTATGLGGFIVSFQLNPVGDFWPLHGPRVTLGRANSGEAIDIGLADATISSRHAVIHVDPIAGTIAVEDTGSTNGTFVNDEHLGFSGRRDLRDGDRLRLGGFTTIVKIIART
jgi:hypothetical protein